MDTASQTRSSWTSRRVVITAVVAGLLLYAIFWTPPALAYFFDRVANIIIIFVLATALAYLIRPIVAWLCRLRLPGSPRAKRSVATLVVLVVGLGLLVLAGLMMASAIADDVKEVGSLLKDAGQQLPNLIDTITQNYTNLVPENIKQFLEKRAGTWAESLLVLSAKLPAWAVPKAFLIVELILVPIIAFYLVTDGGMLRASVIALLPAGYRPATTELFSRLDAMMYGFVRGQFLLCIILGGTTAAILYGAGVSAFLTLGLFRAIAQLVPIIGPIVAGIPVIGIPLLQGNVDSAILVAVLYVAAGLVEAKLLLPVIMGRQVNLHPVIVILALLLGAEFGGILGMVFAVPVAAIVSTTYHWYRDVVAVEAEPL